MPPLRPELRCLQPSEPSAQGDTRSLAAEHIAAPELVEHRYLVPVGALVLDPPVVADAVVEDSQQWVVRPSDRQERCGRFAELAPP
eukprot:6265028-Alexandrium_andersonii.AAC.2